MQDQECEQDCGQTRMAVVGAGYVGMSLAVLLSRGNPVTLVDIDERRVLAVREGRSPIADPQIEAALREGLPLLRATCDADAAYRDAHVVFVAVPTNFDHARNGFDTGAVDEVVDAVCAANPLALVVVKSTLPVGHTDELAARHPGARILFSPEFLREGRALFDNLHPSRIIVGLPREGAATERDAQLVAGLLARACDERDVARLVMGAREAESAKLFSNDYLALRVGFFNEMDSFALANGLDARAMIEAVCLDPRVGGHYNNPSFGYGGYCLPKDTLQLRASFGGAKAPQVLVDAVIEANDVRKGLIADTVCARVAHLEHPVVGVYRLAMKAGSDNFRSCAVADVLALIQGRGVDAIVYEPLLDEPAFMGVHVTHDLARFKASCDLVLANRWDPELADVAERVFTRDLFGRD